ncbi:MAG: hypothetical protein Q9168_008271 [Polycauliona sp. 1 TL-2023]
MASRLDWLRTCKLKQLEAIARATGINSSGTKPVLISHIQEALRPPHNPSSSTPNQYPQQQKHQQRKDDYRIFSIDMGIRNLAYCQLTLPPSWLQSPNPLHTTTTSQAVRPRLNHWSRIDVSSPCDPSPPQTPDTAVPKSKESFTPAIYAPHAHTFLTTHILPHNPTHILIERQRFRSMGGSAVQEWTLRVNMFEAMLYAMLQSYSAEGRWGGEVIPVLPSKVVKYWIDGLDDVDPVPEETIGVKSGVETKKKAGKPKRASLGTEKSKVRKMGIVRDMVQNGSDILLQGQAQEMGDLVMGKGKGSKKRAEKGKGLGKFDDLADCLLQGLAWVKWEENKRLVWEKGLESLDILVENGKVKT